MTDLLIEDESYQFEKSYNQVRKDLHQWYENLLVKLDQISDDLLLDMSTTLDDVHYFASLTNTLLIEEENQLKKARSNEEMNTIEERINQIVSEVQLLQSLSFRLNCDAVKLRGKLRITYNNTDIKSDCLLIKTFPRMISNNNYRFLISRDDAIQLKQKSVPILHCTSLDNEAIQECVLTFDVSDLDSFLSAFASYWELFQAHNELRMLIPEKNIISLDMVKSDERLIYLANRFQLNEIKMFPDLCPKSQERILFLNGKRRDLIQDCIEEIYYNIEGDNQNEKIRLYNPNSLSNKELQEIMMSHMDYGGFIQQRSKTIIENEAEEDDLWNENDEWWNFQDSRNNNSEIIQREMNVSNMQAGVIIGLNALRIDRIKQKTGANVYINGESKDSKRTVFIIGTCNQVNSAYTCIENVLERHKNGQLPMKQRSLHNRRRDN